MARTCRTADKSLFRPILEQYPPGYTAFLEAVQYYISEGVKLVLSSPLEAAVLPGIKGVFFRDFRPFSEVLYNEGTAQRVVSRLENYPFSEDVSAYLCKKFSCRELASILLFHTGRESCEDVQTAVRL